MTDFALVHHWEETIINSAAVALNLYLLYLIRFHSYRARTYQALLSIDALLDLIVAITTLLVQPVLLSGDGYLVLLFNGFVGSGSAETYSKTATVTYLIFHANIVWIPAQFVCRYAYFCANDHRRRVGISTILLLLTWNGIALLVIIPMFQVHSPELQDAGLRILSESGWSIKNDAIPLLSSEPRCIRFIALWTVAMLLSMAIVATCEWKIFKHMVKIGDAIIHDRTRRIHREIHKTLLAMALCPLVSMNIPVFYFIITTSFGISGGPVSIMMSSLLNITTLVNPLTTIVFMSCYRKAAKAHFFSCFGMKRRISLAHMTPTSEQKGISLRSGANDR